VKRVSEAIAAAMIITLVPLHLTARAGLKPMFRHERGHTGRIPYPGPVSPAVKCAFQTFGAMQNSPAGRKRVSIVIEENKNLMNTYFAEVVVRNYREGAQAIQVAPVIRGTEVKICGNEFAASSLKGYNPFEAGFDPWTAGPNAGVRYSKQSAAILDGEVNTCNRETAADFRSVFGTTTYTQAKPCHCLRSAYGVLAA